MSKKPSSAAPDEGSADSRHEFIDPASLIELLDARAAEREQLENSAVEHEKAAEEARNKIVGIDQGLADLNDRIPPAWRRFIKIEVPTAPVKVKSHGVDRLITEALQLADNPLSRAEIEQAMPKGVTVGQVKGALDRLVDKSRLVSRDKSGAAYLYQLRATSNGGQVEGDDS